VALRALPPSTVVESRVRSTPTTVKVADNRSPLVVVLRNTEEPFARSDLSEVLAGLIAGGTSDVVVDLGEVDFIDTSSFFTLAATARLLDRDGRQLSFRSPSRLATRVLKLFGLSDRIDSQDSSL
jgi:anti-anti-sigma factor